MTFTIDILMYSIGSVFFVLALVFARYAMGNAQLMQEALGHRLMAYGAVGFLIYAMVGAIDAFFFSGSGLVYGVAAIWIAGLLLIVGGGFLRAKTIIKVYRISLFKVFSMFPNAKYYLVGIVALVYFGIPIYFLDLLRPLATGFSWFSVGQMVTWAFTFLLLALSERKLYLALKPQLATILPPVEEILLLREDIVAARGYTALLNNFLTALKPALSKKVLSDALRKWFEENPLLFENCQAEDKINTSTVLENLERVPMENKLSTVLQEFSALTSQLLDLYGAVTSFDHACKIIAESYLAVKKHYAHAPVFFNLLRTLPKGILEEEKLGLLGREELETKIKQRTQKLERTVEKLKTTTAEKVKLAEKVEAALKAEEEKATELEKAQLAYLNIMEDLNIKKEALEKTLAELKSTQAQLVQVGKMAAVGQLAAGVAHEINNPLTTAYGFVEILLEECKIPSVQKDLKQIKNALERCRDIPSRLLSFARSRGEREETTEVNKTFKQTISLAANQLWSKKIRVVQKLSPGLPKIKAIPSQLQQVYLNLIFNAQEAMPEGGILKIESRKIALNEKEYVEIRFSDTGRGIAKENLARIFEPFFTTKEPGKGVGLGLWVSYGIIREHSGTIEVESPLAACPDKAGGRAGEVGKGTTFIIRLPVRKNLKQEV